MATHYADIVTLHTIGQTSSGANIHGVRLTSPEKGVMQEVKVHVALLGQLDGDEPVGAEILMRFLRNVIAGKN